MIVVWDLGGVVTSFHPERRLAALAELSGLRRATIHERIWGDGLDAAAERGELEPEAVWSAVLAALDHRVGRDAVRRAWSLAFEPNPGVLALIDQLGAPAALLTNNGPILDEVLDNELSDVGRRFSSRLLSYRLRATKPHPDAFRQAAVALATAPDQLALVDDSSANVAAARALGWRALHFPDPGASSSSGRSRERRLLCDLRHI